jgi:hypothetical protein
MNPNRSHTFNFDFDALPLDSDKSDDVSSDEEVINRSLGNSSGENSGFGKNRKSSSDFQPVIRI